MTLKEWLSTQPRGAQRRLAEAIGVSWTWMTLIVNGHKLPSRKLTLLIEKETGINRATLNPKEFPIREIPSGLSDSAEVIYRRLLDLPVIHEEKLDNLYDDSELVKLVLHEFFIKKDETWRVK
jgi:hypothetical protein